jgi:hypothetical protein
MQYVKESHLLGKEKGINKYLVDLTEAPNEQSVGANFEFADTELTNVPEVDKTALVAWLVQEHDHSHDFMETLTRNRGHNIKICHDMSSCFNYLGISG